MADQRTATERRGVLFVFLAAVLYSIGGLCIKVIPWNGMSINSARNIISVLVVGSYLLLIHHKPRWNRWIALGAVSVCGTNVLFSLANKLTTAATPLYSSSPPLFLSSCWRRYSGGRSRVSWIWPPVPWSFWESCVSLWTA